MSSQRGFGSVALVIAILAMGLLTTAGYYTYSRLSGSNDDGLVGEYGPKPESDYVDSYYAGEASYECSRKIKGKWIKGSAGFSGSKVWEFRPDSEEEATKYCRTTSVIEYHAVIDVLRRPDVSEVIDRYNSTEAWVKALDYRLIADDEYISRILPDYTNVNIHCIVVVHSPEGERFFLENGDKENDYIEIPSSDFLESLNNSSDDDVNTFWLNLR